MASADSVGPSSGAMRMAHAGSESRPKSPALKSLLYRPMALTSTRPGAAASAKAGVGRDVDGRHVAHGAANVRYPGWVLMHPGEIAP